MQRYHEVSLSVPTVGHVLLERQVPRLALKRFRLGPRTRRKIDGPDQSVQAGVKHIKAASGRLYHFTVIDEASRSRLPTVYNHNNNNSRSAIELVQALRRNLTIAIRRI